MFFAPTRPLGLRVKLTLWSSLVLAASLAAGLVWVHYGLRRVLEARNDAFLERKAAELLASVSGDKAAPWPSWRQKSAVRSWLMSRTG